MNYDQFKKIALGFPETTEDPHFEKVSFRVKKKIFVTYNGKENRACLKLPELEQNIFSTFDNNIIHPVPNKWGKQGWTLVYFEQLPDDMFIDMLKIAYRDVAPANLANLIEDPLKGGEL